MEGRAGHDLVRRNVGGDRLLPLERPGGTQGPGKGRTDLGFPLLGRLPRSGRPTKLQSALRACSPGRGEERRWSKGWRRVRASFGFGVAVQADWHLNRLNRQPVNTASPVKMSATGQDSSRHRIPSILDRRLPARRTDKWPGRRQRQQQAIMRHLALPARRGPLDADCRTGGRHRCTPRGATENAWRKDCALTGCGAGEEQDLPHRPCTCDPIVL